MKDFAWGFFWIFLTLGAIWIICYSADHAPHNEDHKFDDRD